MQESPCQGVLFRLGQKQPHPESELDIAHRIWVFTVKQLIDLIDGHDVRHVSNLVVKPSQVNVKLVVIIVSQQFEHHLVKALFLHHLAHHVTVNELVYLLYRHVHSMIRRYVSFEL